MPNTWLEAYWEQRKAAWREEMDAWFTDADRLIYYNGDMLTAWIDGILTACPRIQKQINLQRLHENVMRVLAV